MRLRSTVTAFAVGLAITAGAANAATVHAQLREPGVVWLSDGVVDIPKHASMHNVAKSFVPNFLVIPMRSSVQFPNDDPFFHSIYSTSTVDPFDIGYYDTGPGKIVTFDRPGIISIACHIHARMHATIVVVDGPWQNTARDVRFDNVPAGAFAVHAFSATLGERVATIRIAPRAKDVALGNAL